MSTTPVALPSSSTDTKPTSSFTWNPRQALALELLAGPATHVMLRGGSRSGKTFLLVIACIARALKAPGTTHTILRARFNHLKHSVIFDSFPKAMKLRFPGVPWHLNRTDWFVEFPNGSKILFGGLDTGERVEKILGQEHSTIYLNECSQISYDARNKAVTRLAQRSSLALKAYYDCNPPTVGHWTYQLFEKRVEPKSGEALANPDRYASMMLNPDANRENLATEYLAELEALPEKDRKRFLLGEYLAQVDGALWRLDDIQREAAPKLWTPATRAVIMARMKRIVVAVDPSGCSGPEDTRSDEVGIVVVGLDREKHGYVLEDLSGRYGPEVWAKKAVAAFDDWKGDRIIGERNFGGAMVASTIRSVRATAPVVLVTASRGKTQRAEPVAALYSQGKVTHVGRFVDLEEQMSNFSAAGYQGAKSPDRADAMVWGLSDIMLTGGTYDSSMKWV